MWTISSASDTSGAAGARGHRLSLTALDVTMLRDRHPWVLFAVGAFVLVLLLDLGGHTGIGLASYGVVIPGWGFAVLWLSIWVDGQGWWRSRHARFTMAAIAVATCAVSLSEGVHPVVALLRGPGVLAQAVLTCLLWWRFRPAGRSVGSVAGIWRLLLASLIGALPDLMFSPYGLVSLLPVNADRVFPGLAGAALWVLRGSASAFCLTILGHAILERPAEAVPWPSPRVLLGLATATAGAYGLGVMFNQRLYLLIPVIMWAASVLSVRGAALYSGVILIAAQGMSPLAVTAAGNALDGAFAAETFTLLVVVVTMALARDRQDRERLLGLATARSREAAEQADLMTTIVEAGADAVLTVASDGRVLLANGPAQRLADRLGISMLGLLALAPAGRSSGAGQVVGGQAVGAGQAVSAGQAPVAVVLAGGPATTADVVVRREDAPATIVAIRAFPMTHRGVTGAVVFLADVTEERARTEGLRHFARTVAHDLRNPLTGIALSAELAASALDEGDAAEAAAMMEAVRRSGDRATTLIRDIADYTLADGDVKLAPVCVGELVAGLAAARLGEAGSVPLDLRIDADVNVRADARLLARLFDNLLGNAEKYCESGRLPQVDVVAYDRGDDMATILVMDRGVGIPAGQEEEIFEAFHRVPEHASRFAGSGLGLAICRQVVGRHGGSIRAERRVGGGTTFRITLPLAAEQGPAAAAWSGAAAAPEAQEWALLPVHAVPAAPAALAARADQTSRPHHPRVRQHAAARA